MKYRGERTWYLFGAGRVRVWISRCFLHRGLSWVFNRRLVFVIRGKVYESMWSVDGNSWTVGLAFRKTLWIASCFTLPSFSSVVKKYIYIHLKFNDIIFLLIKYVNSF